MKSLLLICFLLSADAPCWCGETPTADEIMRRVAVNQDRAQNERSVYIYTQQVKVNVRHSNGKLAREETAESVVSPSAKGVERKEQSIAGRYRKSGRYISFQGRPVPDEGTLDGSLAKGFREDLFEGKSKDGIGDDLFPLTTKEQKDMRFELVGEEAPDGRPAYRIRFGPVEKNDIGWAGEALIDKEEFQPIFVSTRLSRKLPLFVRAALGTDLPGLGFSTHYKRLEKDVWFPVSFGTEFRIHAVFFINRTIAVSMENSGFKRATAESQIEFGEQVSDLPQPKSN